MKGAVRIVQVIPILVIMTGCTPAIDVGVPDYAAPSTSTPPPPVFSTRQTPTASEDPALITPTLPPPADLVPSSLIDEAKTDLAQRLSLAVDQIILLEASAVTWPDSSLGCPEEGMAYAQVLTPGYLIRLEAGAHQYEYHASRGTVFYCQNPSAPVPGVSPDV